MRRKLSDDSLRNRMKIANVTINEGKSVISIISYKVVEQKIPIEN